MDQLPNVPFLSISDKNGKQVGVIKRVEQYVPEITDINGDPFFVYDWSGDTHIVADPWTDSLSLELPDARTAAVVLFALNNPRRMVDLMRLCGCEV